MLKINVGWSEERLAQQIAFGLSEGNLKRLKHDPTNTSPTGPIAIKGEDLQLENTNFVIFAAEQDQENLTKQLVEMIFEVKQLMIFEVYEFRTSDGKKSPSLEGASLVVGTLGKECGLAYPVSADRFPSDAAKGELFEYVEGDSVLNRSADGRIEGDQPVMNLDGIFYVVPVVSGDSMVWFIGLHEVSFEKLRKGEVLSFRARLIDGEGTNVEVNVFWGKTKKAMAEQLKNSAR